MPAADVVDGPDRLGQPALDPDPVPGKTVKEIVKLLARDTDPSKADYRKALSSPKKLGLPAEAKGDAGGLPLPGPVRDPARRHRADDPAGDGRPLQGRGQGGRPGRRRRATRLHRAPAAHGRQPGAGRGARQGHGQGRRGSSTTGSRSSPTRRPASCRSTRRSTTRSAAGRSPGSPSPTSTPSPTRRTTPIGRRGLPPGPDRGPRRRRAEGGGQPGRRPVVLLRHGEPGQAADQVHRRLRRVPGATRPSSTTTAPPSRTVADRAPRTRRAPHRGARVRCAVLGDPIGHSLSPALHRAGYDAVGPRLVLRGGAGALGRRWRRSWPSWTTPGAGCRSRCRSSARCWPWRLPGETRSGCRTGRAGPAGPTRSSSTAAACTSTTPTCPAPPPPCASGTTDRSPPPRSSAVARPRPRSAWRCATWVPGR